MTSRLKNIAATGQAVWFDFVERRFLAEGRLRRLIEQDGVTGVTSNPAIFEKAMAGEAYHDGMAARLRQGDAPAIDIYEHLAVEDIRAAAEDLAPVYAATDAQDGYVSLEVAPHLAESAAETIAEGKRLWERVAKPNLMIKVPGTPEGVVAMRALTEAGINVNVTLLFDRARYAEVAEAYIQALEARAARGEEISRIASVASFFVSRIDAVLDKEIDRRLAAGDAEATALQALRGKIAIANAKLAYRHFQELTAGQRWQDLAAKGAMPQRLLWASTGTKDPAYSDVLYVETLLGPATVNTMPPATMDAFRDHGNAAVTLTEEVEAAAETLAQAARLGLDLAATNAALVTAGLKQFSDAADALLAVVERRRQAFLQAKSN
jgi:transaldolase/glucose-6-phosphate isomerase